MTRNSTATRGNQMCRLHSRLNGVEWMANNGTSDARRDAGQHRLAAQRGALAGARDSEMPSVGGATDALALPSLGGGGGGGGDRRAINQPARPASGQRGLAAEPRSAEPHRGGSSSSAAAVLLSALLLVGPGQAVRDRRGRACWRAAT
eukprot:CAMPEP_0198312930 /NCGR_PEP_ID=MMETSP1450-20131203/4126_1 /TAXON_ID=753684 ORGANISM="Madagascaria erythrocladiodes, Strain CCMP3234" /NCGR_SAMPLE_ID=MMETSP1450 /ASSEMBLY_ACC=CAM_ASM_001115 /LENGTH=147 /DNA_ID=CAMNT_0044015895 /DNA_START=868 /DNA_END=1309 /DNA_ORIENTATION=+